ncbi:MAG: type III-B CRISPR module-associated Cmr3 family protein [Thermoguttaceae bacterium]
MSDQNERRFILRPIDAWFFRDGRPYNESESNQTGVESVFPPSPQTVVGAIRAALARSQGWSGRNRERWNEKLRKTLGDGFEDLGELRFTVPLPSRGNGGLTVDPLYPMPLHVVGAHSRNPDDTKPNWTPTQLLAPAKVPLLCDQGEVRLPTASGQGLKSGEGRWVTKDGLARILAANPPHLDEIVSSESLWKHEHRVGLARADDTRTAEEGMLYSPVFVRPRPDTALTVTVFGLPNDWHVPKLIAFGGEGRMAECVEVEPFDLPAALNHSIRSADGQFVVVLLSPLCLTVGDGNIVKGLGRGDCLPGIAGTRIVSGCVGKPIRIGGWNSLDNKPLPLRPYLPAGSVFFCECDRGVIDSVLTKHSEHIGDMTAYGFGRIAIGVWPSRGGDS